VSKKVLLTGLSLLIIGGCGWFFYYYSDEATIQRICYGVAEKLSKDEQENQLVLSMKMRTVKSHLALVCDVVIPDRGYKEGIERELAVQYLIFFRSRFLNFRINLEQLAIDIDPKGQARATSLIQLSGKTSRQPAVEENHRVEIFLGKQKGDWHIVKVILPNDLVVIGSGS